MRELNNNEFRSDDELTEISTMCISLLIDAGVLRRDISQKKNFAKRTINVIIKAAKNLEIEGGTASREKIINMLREEFNITEH